MSHSTVQSPPGGRDSPIRTKSGSLSRKAVMGLSQEAVRQFVSVHVTHTCTVHVVLTALV